MAINQRSLGSDIQKRCLDFRFEVDIGHGHSGVIALIPFPCQVNAIQMTSLSQQDSPYLILSILRFIPGTGFTTIAFGSTFTVPIFGTSGVLTNGVSLPSDQQVLKLGANDIIKYYSHSSIGSGSFNNLTGSIIVTPVQDQIKYFGNLL